jgi:RNA polymerase sigma-70 factor (ECF subfamily)
LILPSDVRSAYAQLMPPIQAKCRRLLGRTAAAEDVAQETFLRFWRTGRHDTRDLRAAMAWLYRTCTHLAIDLLRERRRFDVSDGDDAARALPCTVDLAAWTEARATIAEIARAVPDDELAVAILCRVDGVSQPEAAEVLGITERTVRRRLVRFDGRIASLRKEYSA